MISKASLINYPVSIEPVWMDGRNGTGRDDRLGGIDKRYFVLIIID